MFKKILKIVALSLLFAAWGTYFYFSTVLVLRKEEEIRCSNICISILDSASKELISKEEVKLLLEKSDIAVYGIPLNQVRLDSIETFLQGKHSIKTVQACTYSNGTLKIEISQYSPILRIHYPLGDSYLCKEKFIIPVPHKNKLSMNLPVLTGGHGLKYGSSYRGAISEDDTFLSNIYKFIEYTANDRFWKVQLKQIEASSQENLQLYTLIGKPEIRIGNLENFENKLHKIYRFYQTLAPEIGVDYYKIIDARYKGQLVCIPKPKITTSI